MEEKHTAPTPKEENSARLFQGLINIIGVLQEKPEAEDRVFSQIASSSIPIISASATYQGLPAETERLVDALAAYVTSRDIISTTVEASCLDITKTLIQKKYWPIALVLTESFLHKQPHATQWDQYRSEGREYFKKQYEEVIQNITREITDKNNIIVMLKAHQLYVEGKYNEALRLIDMMQAHPCALKHFVESKWLQICCYEKKGQYAHMVESCDALLEKALPGSDFFKNAVDKRNVALCQIKTPHAYILGHFTQTFFLDKEPTPFRKMEKYYQAIRLSDLKTALPYIHGLTSYPLTFLKKMAYQAIHTHQKAAGALGELVFAKDANEIKKNDDELAKEMLPHLEQIHALFKKVSSEPSSALHFRSL